MGQPRDGAVSAHDHVGVDGGGRVLGVCAGTLKETAILNSVN